MTFSRSELRRLFTAKLGLELDASTHNPTFTLWHDGKAVARTRISHGSGKDVSVGLITAMARQLGLSGPELRESLSCRISGEAFGQLVLSRASKARDQA